MSDFLDLTPGTLLLFLVLVFVMLLSSLLLQLLRLRLTRRGWSEWLADNETTVVAAIWAALAFTAYLIGPRLLLGLASALPTGTLG